MNNPFITNEKYNPPKHAPLFSEATEVTTIPTKMKGKKKLILKQAEQIEELERSVEYMDSVFAKEQSVFTKLMFRVLMLQSVAYLSILGNVVAGLWYFYGA